MKKIYTEGRPPWYSSHTGKVSQPLLIAVAGGTASGKTTVSRKIIAELHVPWVVHISMDSYYKNLNAADRALAAEQNFNFDHPDCFDVELMVQTLKALKQGKSVLVPEYDFRSHSRVGYTRCYGADVIVFEGLFALYHPEVRELVDIKLFIDEDADIRLARRVRRDIEERGRDIRGVLKQYDRFVKPAFDDYIFPTKQYADLVVPRAGKNVVALEIIAEHCRSKLRERGASFGLPPKLDLDSIRNTPNLHVLRRTSETCILQTIIRSKSTPRSQFVFCSHRLIRLLVEFALALLPHSPVQVLTPTGESYDGLRLDCSLVTASIMRAGEAMEPALREVCRQSPLVKMLIQSDERKTPRLFYMDQCTDLARRHVLLLDPLLATGATVIMAIRVLLEHGVPEENILFLNLISAPEGIAHVVYLYPKVKIVTTELDAKLNEHGYVMPGVGNFGDRYFGTD